MGFWSGVCEFVGDIASTAIDFCKSAVSVVSKIGTAVVSVAKPLITTIAVLAPQIGVPLTKALKVVEAVVAVCSIAAGIINEEDSVDELGERALEAAEQGINMQNYKNPEDYIDRIRDIPLNPDRNKYKEEDRIFAGMSVLTCALQSKLGVAPDLYAFFARYKQFFTEERITSYIKYAEIKDCDINNIRDYFSSNSTMEGRADAYNQLMEMEKARNPNFQENLFKDELINAKLAKIAPEGTAKNT